MAQYRLRMDLSTKNVRKIAEQLAEIKQGFNMKVWKASRITAEHVKRFIDLQYATATDYIGWRDVDVEVIQLPKRAGYRVAAHGEDIYFLEYGTGVYAGMNKPSDVRLAVPAEPGVWSQNYGQGQYVRGTHEYWMYGPVKIKGSRPAWAFHYARQYSPDFIRDAVREVFG